MHLVKNIAEHVIKLLPGIEDLRREEQHRNHFRCTWVKSGCEKDPLPFSLSREREREREREEMVVTNSRALSITVPSGVDWRRRKSLDRKSLSYVKSVEWKHVLSSCILKYCIRGLLGEQQRTTLFELRDVSAVLAYDIAVDDINSIKYRVHRVLSLLERDFPVALHVIVFHHLHHMPMFLCRLRAACGFWMYPKERFNSWICARITN